MASHLEQAMDQADAHITLTFMNASLNPDLSKWSESLKSANPQLMRTSLALLLQPQQYLARPWMFSVRI